MQRILLWESRQGLFRQYQNRVGMRIDPCRQIDEGEGSVRKEPPSRSEVPAMKRRIKSNLRLPHEHSLRAHGRVAP